MANRNWSNGGDTYSMHVMPVLLDCNFIVDSTNGNGLGIRSLKGPLVKSVFMHTTASPAPGNPNPVGNASPPVGALNLGQAASFEILAYSAITNSASKPSAISGNVGITPNNSSSITGFPPATVSNGAIHAADSLAVQAQTDATAAFVAGNLETPTPITAVLDGQTLTPGVYSESSSTFSLAGSGNGTLTLNGAGVYIFQAASTLVTGAGGIPTIAFTGGATASNTYIYWLVGSSATINVGVTSANATFYGTIIAQASITVTQGGTVVGRMLALTGAVTLTNSTNATGTAASLPAGSVGGGGAIIVNLSNNYNRSFSGFNSIVSPLSGTPLTSVVAGNAYTIVSLGTASLAQWKAVGVISGLKPSVGMSFVATASQAIGGSAAVEASALTGSNVTSIEVVGDPNTKIANQFDNTGSQFILQCFQNGVPMAPVDGSVISLAFYLSNSGVQVQGE